MILDGNGYLWQTGYDNVGAAGFAAATNRTALTKSTAAPGGTIVNFWSLWSGDTSNYQVTFIRVASGLTWVCGQGANGNNTQGTTGNTTAIVGPTVLTQNLGQGTGIYQVTEVYMHVAYTNTSYFRTIHWLTDSGKVFAQGYNNYGEFGAPWSSTGANSSSSGTDETGSTSYPVLMYLPPSTKIKQILPVGGGSVTNTTITTQHGVLFMTDTGQVFGTGQARSSNVNRPTEGSFIGYSPTVSEGTAVNMPVSIQYAR